VPTPGAHRVIFIDLGRFLALVFMLYGHTVSALLAPEYQRGTWFDVWQFQRGLTSSLFLLLAGFAFSIATSRHWGSHQRVSPASLRRARRFAFFVLLGYALHFPVARFALLPTATAEQWRSFLAVDVLQLIGVTFLAVQALVLLTRSRRVFTAVALGLSIVTVGASHPVWAAAAGSGLPAWLAAYLTPATGSLFPLFPWAAYVLCGAALGQLFVAWGAARLTRYAAWALLAPGALLASIAWMMLAREGAPWSQDPWNFMPIQVPRRVGSCLMILAGIAYASQRLTRLPRFFAAVAQETLPIYFVHLCIVYGSVWSPGLLQAFGPTLGPLATGTCVVLLLAAMAGLGWTWHWMKHARPRAARWTMAAATVLLVGRLL
jgi:uncharacterized membrane protein